MRDGGNAPNIQSPKDDVPSGVKELISDCYCCLHWKKVSFGAL